VAAVGSADQMVISRAREPSSADNAGEMGGRKERERESKGERIENAERID
jgi:hypothetical protein